MSTELVLGKYLPKAERRDEYLQLIEFLSHFTNKGPKWRMSRLQVALDQYEEIFNNKNELGKIDMEQRLDYVFNEETGNIKDYKQYRLEAMIELNSYDNHKYIEIELNDEQFNILNQMFFISFSKITAMLKTSKNVNYEFKPGDVIGLISNTNIIPKYIIYVRSDLSINYTKNENDYELPGPICFIYIEDAEFLYQFPFISYSKKVKL